MQELIVNPVALATVTTLKQRARIKRDDLPNECAEQPHLYVQAAELFVNALYDMKKAKHEMELFEAQLSREIRGNPVKFGIDKVTEASVQTAIGVDANRNALGERLIKLESIVSFLGVLKDAFDQRRSMLKAEVDLAFGNYQATDRLESMREREEAIARAQ